MMERALKERIIGAVVLVALVVLVVPVFLDGPPDSEEIISERVPLPGQAEQKSQTIVLDRDRTDPVPANDGKGSQPSPQPQVVARQQEPEPEPEPKPAAATPAPQPAAKTPARETPAAVDNKAPQTEAAAASTTGMFAVQLGSFSSQENAERLAADLRKQGFAAFLSQLSTDNGQLHRVRIGPQKDRAAAEAIAARLQKAGHRGQVVPHP